MHAIIPSHTAVIDIARQAQAAHLAIITDGSRTRLCPAQHIPPGWYRIAVKIKAAA